MGGVFYFFLDFFIGDFLTAVFLTAAGFGADMFLYSLYNKTIQEYIIKAKIAVNIPPIKSPLVKYIKQIKAKTKVNV